MASTVVAPRLGTSPHAQSLRSSLYGIAISSALTPFALLLEGYHPFSEDGGLYLAGVQYVLDPRLYSRSLPFVTAHLHYSVFAALLAALVHGTGASLETVVFLTHLACIWASLLAAWSLACVCFPSSEERSGVVLLLAAWFGLPIAGTSLQVADPYLTARSFSTPFVILALTACLAATAAHCKNLTRQARRFAVACLLAIIAAALFHPLMAGYGAACTLALAFLELRMRLPQWARFAIVITAALVLAATVQALAAPESDIYRTAALTRTYWFPWEWRWFELAGLGAPLLLLVPAVLRSPASKLGSLARMGLCVGFAAIILSLFFARPELSPKLVARLQPLRVFQVVYLVMIVILGGAMGGRLLKRSTWRWAAALLLLTAVMLPGALGTCAHSRFLELPVRSGSSPRSSPWVEAFLWIRQNTGRDDLFALDANYITRPGEEAQSFRAIAQRSSLPDFSKDGGEAAITPALSPLWASGVAAQTSLSDIGDATRHARLDALGVNWLVLSSSAVTQMPCPYSNGVVKVCRFSH